ncbi:hypothetical protein BFJ72_g1514 [Fusarium proliferatum]|uniref:NADP-dependent oxidoreductase domain-containing protein n=1 Tax=Gibberella intermedia TaxID=948311 RepID=A0A420U4A2_GIBIN|nr:hypothetical protein BFJ72_g1514 [Fusarium proliferatum]
MPLVTQNVKPRVILGLMTFGPPGSEQLDARIFDPETYNKALDLFQSKGYNEVDTARIYVGGKQEGWTGSQTNWKERGLTVDTKVKYPAQPGENTYDKVIESVETSLKELGTDCIDLLYLHRPDRGTPFQETLGAINKLHKDGKFVRFGISNFTAYEVAEVVMICKYNNWVRPTVYQGMYNCLTRSIEAELFVACRRYGLDIVVYNPIAGGLLSGKIKSMDIKPESGRFSDQSKIGTAYRQRYFRESTFKALKAIEEATEKNGLSMLETALRWIIHHSGLKVTNGNDGIIIGMSNIQQLEQNLELVEKGPLPDEVVKALDQAWLYSKADTANYWHGDLEYTYDVHEALFDSDSSTSSSDDTTCEPGPSSTARPNVVGARGTADHPSDASDLDTKRYDPKNTKIHSDSEWLELDNMDPNDLRRPNYHRHGDGKSGTPLLCKEDDPERGRAGYSPPNDGSKGSRESSEDDLPYHPRESMGRPGLSRRSTMRSRSPQTAAAAAEDSTKKRYTYAGFFLIISLIAFCVQTELSAYIQHDLGWDKAYCMMYFTHGSWIVLWPVQLLILRFQKRDVPWPVFWKRHKQQLRTTAIMIEKQTLDVFHISIQHRARPVRYFVRFTAIITCSLTVAGLSWYIAVSLTTPSDLTAIYNCSAFFAYVFSVPLLREPLRLDKSVAVLIAIGGVLVVAYGDTKEGGESVEAGNRFLGNLVIGVGSVLYGLYEVLYKRYACPPEGCSPGRGMIFANTFGSLIGLFTLTVLWLPLPILDWLNIEKFEIPAASTCWLILLAVLSNATFSGSFLVLISLTSPVLSSVAALLTIFIVAIVDWMITGEPLSFAAIVGGAMIIVAFLGLTWSTYREMKEHAAMEPVPDFSDSDKDGDIDSDED